LGTLPPEQNPAHLSRGTGVLAVLGGGGVARRSGAAQTIQRQKHPQRQGQTPERHHQYCGGCETAAWRVVQNGSDLKRRPHVHVADRLPERLNPKSDERRGIACQVHEPCQPRDRRGTRSVAGEVGDERRKMPGCFGIAEARGKEIITQ